MTDLQDLEHGAVLHVRVGPPWPQSTACGQEARQALDRGGLPDPHLSIGFESLSRLFEVFTPPRWELTAALRASGPLTAAELAHRLGQNPAQVRADLALLTEWLVVAPSADGRVQVPWAQVVIAVTLAPAPSAG